MKKNASESTGVKDGQGVGQNYTFLCDILDWNTPVVNAKGAICTDCYMCYHLLLDFFFMRTFTSVDNVELSTTESELLQEYSDSKFIFTN